MVLEWVVQRMAEIGRKQRALNAAQERLWRHYETVNSALVAFIRDGSVTLPELDPEQ